MVSDVKCAMCSGEKKLHLGNGVKITCPTCKGIGLSRATVGDALDAKVRSRPSPDVVRFVVDGEPVPKGRARSAVQHGRNGQVFVRHYTPAETEAYERRVRVVAQCAVASAGWWTEKADRYTVIVRVYRRYEGKGGDLDNYVKGAIDAIIRGVVIPDDRYVRGIGASLFEDEARPRLEVEVRKMAKRERKRAA